MSCHSSLKFASKGFSPLSNYSRRLKMPITEFVFPSYKLDPESIAGLKEKGPEITQAFSGVQGLQAGFRGPLLEDNGSTIDPKAMRTILVLEWDNSSSFHSFYPNSDKFQSLGKILKLFAAAPAVPELYEAEERSISCTTSGITQIIKAESSPEAATTWKDLVEVVRKTSTVQPSFYHANGIEKDDGVFLGLIGWKNLQEYEQTGKHSSVLDGISKLSKVGKVQNIIVQLNQMNL